MDILAQNLSQTLDPSTRKQGSHHLTAAELALAQFESNPQFAPSLLELVSRYPKEAVGFSAAVYFKNFVKRRWKQNEGEQDMISGEDRDKIKVCKF